MRVWDRRHDCMARLCVRSSVRSKTWFTLMIDTHDWLSYRVYVSHECQIEDMIDSQIDHTMHSMSFTSYTYIECVRGYTEWIVSHRTHSRRVKAVSHRRSCVLSRIWRSHVTHMNESWHTYVWIIQVWAEDGPCHYEARDTYAWVMSRQTNDSFHTWYDVIWHMNEWCHTYQWFISHIQIQMSRI